MNLWKQRKATGILHRETRWQTKPTSKKKPSGGITKEKPRTDSGGKRKPANRDRERPAHEWGHGFQNRAASPKQDLKFRTELERLGGNEPRVKKIGPALLAREPDSDSDSRGPQNGWWARSRATGNEIERAAEKMQRKNELTNGGRNSIRIRMGGKNQTGLGPARWAGNINGRAKRSPGPEPEQESATEPCARWQLNENSSGRETRREKIRTDAAAYYAWENQISPLRLAGKLIRQEKTSLAREKITQKEESMGEQERPAIGTWATKIGGGQKNITRTEMTSRSEQGIKLDEIWTRGSKTRTSDPEKGHDM
jgi:hypothetical protein